MDAVHTTRPKPSPSEIGQRVRTIRRRRGLSLDAAAGLAGVTKPYLSMLERGLRRFERRGLLEDIANALGCSVTDLTGQPFVPGDRAGAEALATLPGISIALFDTTLDDVPDVPARPLHELVAWARIADEQTAHSRYDAAGRHLGTLLTDLHVHAVTGTGDDQRTALAALVEACMVASSVARSLGNADLAITAAARGQEAARRLESPALSGFAAMTSMSALSRLGARHRSLRIAATELARLVDVVDPSAPDTAAAEALGMLHLSSAHMAAKAARSAAGLERTTRVQVAATHLSEAADLARRVGEQNTLWFSFGPANVSAWALSIAVESGEGPAAAERITAAPGYDAALTAADRRAALHFDLGRAFAQAGGTRDAEALRHLDTADRIAPQRIRHDPVARELLVQLDHRTRVRSWELRSLKNRLGVR